MTGESTCTDENYPEFKRYYDRCSETCEQGAARLNKPVEVKFADKKRN